MIFEVVPMNAMGETWFNVYRAPARNEKGFFTSESFVASFNTEEDAKLFKQAKEAQWLAQNPETTIDSPLS